MADYNAISDTQLDPDAPLTSQLGYQWRDNPEAIATGAAGATRIDPINAMAHQGVASAVGMCVFATSSTAPVTYGSTVLGSTLSPACLSNISGDPSGAAEILNDGSTLTGSWVCLGTAPSLFAATLFMRIS